MRSIGSEETPNGANDVEGRLARTQTFAALIVAVLVLATVAIALTLERPDTDVDRSTWAYDMVQLEQARRMGLTGSGVRVGIVDTGVDMDNAAMDGVKVVAWLDLVSGRKDPYDDLGHGTAMASIIAGRSPLRGGVTDAELIVVKVLDEDNPFSDEVIADGIDFCLDPDGDGDYGDGADIISLSLGGEYEDIEILIGSKTQAAIAQAVANGVVVVAAAGNDGSAEDVMLPSRLPDVISVGAVDKREQMAPFSSRGNDSVERPDPDQKPEIVAPGVDIITAHVDGQYARGSGTSHATAIVSAVLAAALTNAPELLHDGARGGNETSIKIIKTALMETARPLEGQAIPHDAKAGYGLAQAVDLALELRE
ncbi:MAG: S8 family serine peptidase [Candidatus Thermoplasmatota archaeon]|nr:S8 family serine peptidase [Candidatus Thermoplasmatota archaeon]